MQMKKYKTNKEQIMYKDLTMVCHIQVSKTKKLLNQYNISLHGPKFQAIQTRPKSSKKH